MLSSRESRWGLRFCMDPSASHNSVRFGALGPPYALLLIFLESRPILWILALEESLALPGSSSPRRRSPRLPLPLHGSACPLATLFLTASKTVQAKTRRQGRASFIFMHEDCAWRTGERPQAWTHQRKLPRLPGFQRSRAWRLGRRRR
jgi:hypothetical protein